MSCPHGRLRLFAKEGWRCTECGQLFMPLEIELGRFWTGLVLDENGDLVQATLQ